MSLIDEFLRNLLPDSRLPYTTGDVYAAINDLADIKERAEKAEADKKAALDLLHDWADDGHLHEQYAALIAAHDPGAAE